MSQGLHEIRLVGGDQDVVHVPSVRVDDAPAPTFVIEDLTVSDDSDDRVIASGSATLDALSLLVEEESGRGTTNPRRISAAAPAGSGLAVGRRYAIEDVSGRSEVFTAAGAEDYYVEASTPLGGSYQPDSRIRGVELRATFPAAAAAREELLEEDRRLRVTWTYGLRGTVVSVHELLVVTRGSADLGYIGEAKATLRDEWEELVKGLRGSTGLDRLVKSCARRVRVLLRAKNIRPERFLAGEQGFEVLLARCLWRFGELGLVPGGTSDPTQWTEDMRQDFLNLWRGISSGDAGTPSAETNLDDMAPTGDAPPRRRVTVLK